MKLSKNRNLTTAHIYYPLHLKCPKLEKRDFCNFGPQNHLCTSPELNQCEVIHYLFIQPPPSVNIQFLWHKYWVFLFLAVADSAT